MTLFPEHFLHWVVASPGIVTDPDVFPLLPGQTLVMGKTPIWSTSISSSVSGRERRRSNWSYPRWRFKLRYEVLRERPSLPELSRMYAFFCVHAGQFSPFSYWDPYDNLVENQAIGAGNGVNTVFQLARSIGVGSVIHTEPVRRSIAPSFMVDGVSVSGWSLDNNGRVTLASAPASGAVVTWSGQFMHLCRFAVDEISPEQMTADLWSLDGVELITVKR